jgi:hypothetical protein
MQRLRHKRAGLPHILEVVQALQQLLALPGERLLLLPLCCGPPNGTHAYGSRLGPHIGQPAVVEVRQRSLLQQSHQLSHPLSKEAS